MLKLNFLFFKLCQTLQTSSLIQYETGSDYIIRSNLGMNSDYIVQTIPNCGLRCYKQGLESL